MYVAYYLSLAARRLESLECVMCVAFIVARTIQKRRQLEGACSHCMRWLSTCHRSMPSARRPCVCCACSRFIARMSFCFTKYCYLRRVELKCALLLEDFECTLHLLASSNFEVLRHVMSSMIIWNGSSIALYVMNMKYISIECRC